MRKQQQPLQQSELFIIIIVVGWPNQLRIETLKQHSFLFQEWMRTPSGTHVIDALLSSLRPLHHLSSAPSPLCMRYSDIRANYGKHAFFDDTTLAYHHGHHIRNLIFNFMCCLSRDLHADGRLFLFIRSIVYFRTVSVLLVFLSTVRSLYLAGLVVVRYVYLYLSETIGEMVGENEKRINK